MRDALLVDIRLKPFSRKPGFTKSALRRRLGDRYQHIQALGNVNYNTGGPIQLLDKKTGYLSLTMHLKRQPCIIMCACSDLLRCHRAMIARDAEKRGITVVHLSTQHL